ncbi:ParM/StbA family protein [Pleurocapsa sp. CCALA 161]|uniref:ParM/StbA family protein n=1 Tax=Pleurocapsa sp. CCALA 161 TaxID=2107688 RepID=UPI0011B1EE74|nr:ParM/StbA family protein [Pleurocapsa sp. CCALA 161]
MAMGKPEVPDLVISVDLGGSLTKVAAATADGQYCLLALASEVSEIPQAILKDVQSGFWGDANPESMVWVGVKDGLSYAVGKFARDNFSSQINLALSKTDLAVPKILALLWVLQQKLNLGSSFYVRLGVLLPAGECSALDRQELIDLLVPALKGFSTPTGKMSVRLFGNLVIKPEGGGVFLNYKQDEKSHLAQRSAGILGIGFRNSNLLICTDGTISDGDRITSNLGFHSLIQRTKELIGSTVDEVELATIVARAGYEINSRIIRKYLAKIGKERREEAFSESIAKSQTMYWSQLINWFKLVGADCLDDLIFYGGTTEYLKEPLAEYFKDRVERISWNAGAVVPPELLKSAVAEKEQSGLDFRFIDCWCFLEFICNRQSGYGLYTKALAVEDETAVLKDTPSDKETSAARYVRAGVD